MHRFFLKQPITNTVVITGPDMVHIQKVLRLGAGDCITVCDGKGFESDAVIESAGKDGIRIRCGEAKPCASEPSVKITLFQALPKTGKMETVVQKCVELGAYKIVPMLTSRCVAQPKDSFLSKIDRWQRVSEEAAKQSRRGIVPEIGSLCTPDSFPANHFDRILVAYENEHVITLKKALQGFSGSTIAVMIGPEGGFSEEEVRKLQNLGGISVSLGPRILRTETAGMAVIAQILYEVDQ